jgi:hypothetical protein
MAILSERDDRAWELLSAKVSRETEPYLHPGVLANRSLANARDLFGLAGSLSTARAATNHIGSRSDCLLRTDVRSFYPSVTPSTAFSAIAGLGLRDEGRAVAEMLDGWGSEGYAGLPIGPPGSAVIANAVLHGVDQALRPLPYLRWVDDYLIGLRTGRRVAEVLDRFDTALDYLGLERSEPKTTLFAGAGFIWPGTYGGGRPSE